MKKTLQTLSEYQIKALEKGIEFRIDLGYNSKGSATANVEMHFTSTGDISKCYVFNTSFSENNTLEKKKEKLDNIKYFIDTIVKEEK